MVGAVLLDLVVGGVVGGLWAEVRLDPGPEVGAGLQALAPVGPRPAAAGGVALGACAEGVVVGAGLFVQHDLDEVGHGRLRVPAGPVIYHLSNIGQQL